MNRDIPILLASAQGIGLAAVDYFTTLSYATAMIIVLTGTIYMIWKIK